LHSLYPCPTRTRSKLERRVREQREQVGAARRRVEEAQRKIDALRGSQRATRVFSPAKFPEVENRGKHEVHSMRGAMTVSACTGHSLTCSTSCARRSCLGGADTRAGGERANNNSDLYRPTLREQAKGRISRRPSMSCREHRRRWTQGAILMEMTGLGGCLTTCRQCPQCCSSTRPKTPTEATSRRNSWETRKTTTSRHLPPRRVLQARRS